MAPALPDFLQQRHGEIVALAQRFGVATLTLFGSAATGEFDPARSDVDFVVKFQPMPPRDHADAYFGLLSALEDLLGRPVDLLEQEAIRNPYLQRSIERSQRIVYAA